MPTHYANHVKYLGNQNMSTALFNVSFSSWEILTESSMNSAFKQPALIKNIFSCEHVTRLLKAGKLNKK